MCSTLAFESFIGEAQPYNTVRTFNFEFALTKQAIHDSSNPRDSPGSQMASIPLGRAETVASRSPRPT